jgi:hypothetical protein
LKGEFFEAMVAMRAIQRALGGVQGNDCAWASSTAPKGRSAPRHPPSP